MSCDFVRFAVLLSPISCYIFNVFSLVLVAILGLPSHFSAVTRLLSAVYEYRHPSICAHGVLVQCAAIVTPCMCLYQPGESVLVLRM